jgi:DNA primase
MENETWISFAMVTSAVSFEMLIIHYGIASLSRKGTEVRLKCPFHNGKTDTSMSINLAENKFYCFGCKSGGNVLDFVAKQENCTVKEAAVKLNQWFQIQATLDEENEREAIISESELSPMSIIARIESELSQLKTILNSQTIQ